MYLSNMLQSRHFARVLTNYYINYIRNCKWNSTSKQFRSLNRQFLNGSVYYERSIVYRLLQAVDPENDPVSYSIVSGNDLRQFAIGDKSGIITVIRKLDREDLTRYQLVRRYQAAVRAANFLRHNFRAAYYAFTLHATSFDRSIENLFINLEKVNLCPSFSTGVPNLLSFTLTQYASRNTICYEYNS